MPKEDCCRGAFPIRTKDARLSSIDSDDTKAGGSDTSGGRATPATTTNQRSDSVSLMKVLVEVGTRSHRDGIFLTSTYPRVNHFKLNAMSS
jgi:hypothetical protein